MEKHINCKAKGEGKDRRTRWGHL